MTSPAEKLRFARDGWAAALLAAAALALYAATLLPGVGAGDTAEFQRVLPTLDVAHPTGYPLYTMLGWLWSWLPLGTPAWRISLFSAAAAAAAVGVLYLAARALGQVRPVAAGAALALAVSRTFWSQATIAEVYALAALIEVLLLLALLRWRAGRWRLWPAGLLLGLGLAHHRTIILVAPGALLFVLLSRRAHWAGLWREALPALVAAAAGCLLYLYLPLRAPAWLDSWRTFLRVIAGSDALSAWLNVAEPWRVAWGHLRELWARFIWPQFTPLGVLLAALGLGRVAWRDRALAVLLGLGYLLTLVFCVLFFVGDVEVFLLSGHVIAALLIGEGAALLLTGLQKLLTTKAPRHQAVKNSDVQAFKLGGVLSLALLALPALLLWRNLPAVRAANTHLPELAARATLAQDLPANALIVAEWEAVEPLRYLQSIEGVRPDVEVRPLNEDVLRGDIDAALAAGRAAYLLSARPGLGLAQRPEGRLWRVSSAPIELAAASATNQQWRDGLTLTGFTLPPGPYRPGEIVPVTLAWQARSAPQESYTLFVHLVGPDGAVWGQQDRPPARPTAQWQPGEQAIDLYGPALRLDAPPGRYRVLVGWYSTPTLARLALENGAADSFVLGEIEVLPA